MATQGTYYLDAPSLGSATVIYSDINLTIIAADGFYSDATIVREQVSGALLPQTTCPSCATPCGGTISASGNQGMYYVDTDLGTDTGAVIVRFDPYGVPDGVLGVFNGVSYNGLSSPLYGWRQGVAGLPTYIGSTTSDCGIVANSPYTLNEFEYTGVGFNPLGTTTSVTVLSGQMQLNNSGPGNCLMVIPKTTAAPSVLSMQFIGPCSGTAFSIGVSCPAALPSFVASNMQTSSSLACLDGIDQTYYVAYLNGSAGTLGLYDLVFSDPNGEFKLSAGFYKTSAAGANDWFQVDANGAVILFGTCSGVPEAYTIDNAATGTSNDACNGSTTTSTVYALSGSNVPIVSMVFYDSPSLTTPFIGSTGWRKLTKDGINYAAEVDVNGVLTNYVTCTPAPSISVIGVSGYMEPCVGGTIDDHMGAYVGLNANVDVDTQFAINVAYVLPGNSCGVGASVQPIYVTVLAGNSSSSFNACTSGVYFSGGAVICAACIIYCDNPAVTLTGFTC